jgi:predicted P-loop ATPase
MKENFNTTFEEELPEEILEASSEEEFRDPNINAISDEHVSQLDAQRGTAADYADGEGTCEFEDESFPRQDDFPPDPRESEDVANTPECQLATKDPDFTPASSHGHVKSADSIGAAHIEIVGSDPAWKSRLATSKQGNILSNLNNIMMSLNWAPQWHGGFRYDEFRHLIIAARPMPEIPENSQITDHEISLTTAELQKEGVPVTSNQVWEAVRTIAKCDGFHPVREYLDSLVHDGKPRVDKWLVTYLGVEDSNYARAVGRRWLISAVARIFRPGCKADCCLVAEGGEGVRKSTAFSILGGDWFLDGIPDIHGKDALIEIQGKWIIEVSEMTSFRSAKSDQIKAFLSRASDRYRPVYERIAVDFPRQCVLAGTTNDDTYFEGVNGHRRFWPVRTSTIDTVGLFRDRDQLFAEAVVLYKLGAAWHLDAPELVAAAEQQQSERLILDPWQNRIDEYCAHRDDVSSTEILDTCIGKFTGQQAQTDMNRVAACLKIAGFEKYKTSAPPRKSRYRRSCTSNA